MAKAAPIVAPYTAKALARSAGVGERVGEQGQRGREHHRRADALHGAGGVELGDARSRARTERGGREDGHAPDEDAAPSEAVGERAGRKDDGGERERVRVDDPLQAGEARVSRSRRDVRKRGVDDRDVEHQHRRRQADDGERAPLVEPSWLAPFSVSCRGQLSLARVPLGQGATLRPGVRLAEPTGSADRRLRPRGGPRAAWPGPRRRADGRSWRRLAGARRS